MTCNLFLNGGGTRLAVYLGGLKVLAEHGIEVSAWFGASASRRYVENFLQADPAFFAGSSSYSSEDVGCRARDHGDRVWPRPLQNEYRCKPPRLRSHL